jgi:dTMP kinase
VTIFYVNFTFFSFIKVVDGSLPMEAVEEQLRELAMNCISECQEKQLTNLAW